MATTTARPDERLRLLLGSAYVFLLPVQLPLGGDLRLAVSDLFVPLYLVLTSFGLRRTRGAWTAWFPALLGVVGMGLVVSLVTTGDVSDYALIQKGIGLVVLLLAMACLLDCMRTVEQVRTILRAFLAGVVLNVLVSLAAFVLQQSDPSAVPQLNYVGTRLAGLLIDPNAFGGLVACALVVHLCTVGTPMAAAPHRARTFVTALLAVALLLTYSRSAWIAAAAGLVTALALMGRHAVRRLMPVLIGGALLLPVLAALYLPDLGRLASRPDQVLARFTLMEQALDAFAESPLWGIGVGVFPKRHGEIVHNSALWFLAEMGAIGLTVFLGLVVSFALTTYRLTRSTTPGVRTLAIATLAAHAVMLGLSLGIEALYQRHWWLVLAVGGALAAMERSSLARDGART